MLHYALLFAVNALKHLTDIYYKWKAMIKFFLFRFPKDINRKEKWINATGRENWVPTKHNTICSDHFNTNDILITKKGYRYLSDEAIPSKKIVISQSDVSNRSKVTFKSIFFFLLFCFLFCYSRTKSTFRAHV